MIISAWLGRSDPGPIPGPSPSASGAGFPSKAAGLAEQPDRKKSTSCVLGNLSNTNGPTVENVLWIFEHARRQQPKDAFDIVYTLLFYDKGTNAAVAAFAEEVRLNNPACPDAIQCLEQDLVPRIPRRPSKPPTSCWARPIRVSPPTCAPDDSRDSRVWWTPAGSCARSWAPEPE